MYSELDDTQKGLQMQVGNPLSDSCSGITSDSRSYSSNNGMEFFFSDEFLDMKGNLGFDCRLRREIWIDNEPDPAVSYTYKRK